MFITIATFGQKKYESKAASSQLTLEGKSLSGYKTSFDFAWEDVRKGWWKYARDFGTPLNMKSYYKVTIPSQTTDGNVNLEIFTQATKSKKGSDFFLGLQNKKYEEQALTMILDFKKKFYIQHMVDLLDRAIEKADNLSDLYEEASTEAEKKEILERLNKAEIDMELIKEQIREIEKS